MQLPRLPTFVGIFVGTALVGSCASTHDLKRDGPNLFGGGFTDEQMGPGFFLIKAFSNTSPIPTPDSAARTFHYRATQLCPSGYSEIRGVTGAYSSSTPGPTVVVPGKHGGPVDLPGHVITSRIGHVLCTDSPLSVDEALAYLNRHAEN